MKFFLPLFATAFLTVTVAWADKAEVLFDGSSLEAFEYQEGGWVIEKDGSMSCRMEEVTNKKGVKQLKAMGYIWTRKDYSDFVLSLSYKLNGSFYGGKAPSSDPSNPIGEWNTLKLVCKGPIIKISINSEEIISVNVDDWDTAGQNPDGTPNKFKTALKELPRTGRIGFQNHGQVVWFKDVKIRDLAKK